MSDTELQLKAIQDCDFRRLRSLVDVDGPLLRVRDVGDTGGRLLAGRDSTSLDILRYLVTDYGINVNVTFQYGAFANKTTNLLLRACDEWNVDAVRILLEEGADTYCPGLETTALKHVKARLQSQCLSIGVFMEKYLPIIRLLVQYGDGSEIVPDYEFLAASQDPAGSRTPLHFGNQERSRYFKPTACACQGETLADARGTDGEGGDEDFVDVSADSWIEDAGGPFRYSQLHDDHSVRILELEPSGASTDPIRCKLTHYQLSDAPSYEVLSGVWDDSPRTIPISITGDEPALQTLEIPSEVWRALQATRLPDRPRLLWVDAICVDNRDSRERQRSTFGPTAAAILETSTKLLVWLGETADNSDLVFDHLDHWAAQQPPVLNWPNYPTGAPREAFLALCRRPWFFRSRTVLEMGLHAEATALCGGGRTADLYRLLGGSSFLPPEKSAHPILGVDLPSHVRNLISLQDRPGRNRQRGGGITASQVMLPARFCWDTDLGNKIRAVQSLLQRRSALGVGSISGANHDLSTRAGEVFSEFTRELIEQTSDLQVLHWMGTSGRQTPRSGRGGSSVRLIPSWVPNFEGLSLLGVLPRAFGSASYGSSHYLKALSGLEFRTEDGARFIKGSSTAEARFMAVKGRPVDTIARVGEELKTATTIVKNIATTEVKKVHVEDVDVLPGTEEFNRVLLNWEDLAVSALKPDNGDGRGHVSNGKKRFHQPLADAFSDTLQAYDASDLVRKATSQQQRPERQTVSRRFDGFVRWYRRFGTGKLVSAEEELFREVRDAEAWIRGVQKKDGSATQQAGAASWSDCSAAIERASYGRRFFVTKGGTMGLAPPGAKDGDQVVFLPGGRYPFVLRPGGKKGETDTYELIGDCFLYDLDVIGLFEDPTVETQEYVLA